MKECLSHVRQLSTHQSQLQEQTHPVLCPSGVTEGDPGLNPNAFNVVVIISDNVVPDKLCS